MPYQRFTPTTETHSVNCLQTQPPPAGAYDFTMRITGTFTLPEPLTPNLNVADITAQVTDFSFTDGRKVRTLVDTPIKEFLVTTDGTATIIEWFILLRIQAIPVLGSQGHLIETQVGFGGLPAVDDAHITEVVSIDEAGPSINFQALDRARSQTPGTWSSSADPSPAPIPEPSTMLLFGTGLLGLGLFRRHRKTARLIKVGGKAV